MTSVALKEVKRVGEAQFAYCPSCSHWLGCQFWSLSKSVWMHREGTGHSVKLLKYA